MYTAKINNYISRMRVYCDDGRYTHVDDVNRGGHILASAQRVDFFLSRERSVVSALLHHKASARR